MFSYGLGPKRAAWTVSKHMCSCCSISILAAGVLKYVAGGKEATYRTAMRVREEVLKMMQEIIKLPGSFRY